MIKDKVTTIHHGLLVFKIKRKAENPFFFGRMGGYIKNETEKTKQTSKRKGAAPIRKSLKGRRMMGYIYGIITVPIRQIKWQCDCWSNKRPDYGICSWKWCLCMSHTCTQTRRGGKVGRFPKYSEFKYFKSIRKDI